jgi:hypothetical protein
MVAARLRLFFALSDSALVGPHNLIVMGTLMRRSECGVKEK